MLADAINEENNGAYHYVYDRSSVRQKRDPKEIGISSVRGGSIVGDQRCCSAVRTRSSPSSILHIPAVFLQMAQ